MIQTNNDFYFQFPFSRDDSQSSTLCGRGSIWFTGYDDRLGKIDQQCNVSREIYIMYDKAW